MSLKAFHIVFIVLSTLFSLGFGDWAIGNYNRAGEVASLVIGILSLVGAVSLVVYGRWFWKKLRGISWL
jgi:hypothetical protein